ncbi:MAG TPA: DUF3857 domain-containing transglutaminase family protein [Steroidobacteraceae bacterium]|nr:DUF3857 domain-containing transglutaminase family protein [Steroidobacteraceae bacterium]
MAPPPTHAGVPDWLQAQLSVPLPAHDDDTGAVQLYSETSVTVERDGKQKALHRSVYKILRPEGRARGLVAVTFLTPEMRVTGMHGWCIPAGGKPYEVGNRDAAETALLGVLNGELVSDVRTRALQIPGADPGSIVGYEYEEDSAAPLQSQVEWMPQDLVPVREARYTLRLPGGWRYEANWIHHPAEEPTALAPGEWQWTVRNEPAIRIEGRMPPWQGLAGRLIISLIPPAGQARPLATWADIGTWYLGLTRDRREASPALKQRVLELTASVPTLLGKIEALASAVQNEVRYVAIELGVGGYQPHAAADVLAHGYGDCKDKATLLSAMLAQIGVDSYYVIINSVRGAITADTPANLGFNHVILAIRLPDELKDPSLQAVIAHPKLGRILLFDPTDPFTPFGRLSGALQASYALLVTPDGGELVKTPLMPIEGNGVRRTAELTLDGNGDLSGDVRELWLGDSASAQRAVLSSATRDTEKIRPVQAMLASSLATFDILKAAVANAHVVAQPFEWRYTFQAQSYAKRAANLLLLRPHVFGNLSSALLETPQPREYPVEFNGAERDTDEFDITLPPGYQVDEMPPAIDVDDGFAAYHSKTEEVGHVLHYTRTFEIREVSVPTSSAEKLKRLYRIIEGDQRAMAVLKSASP